VSRPLRALLVVLALGLGVRALLPHLVLWAIESQGTAQLGRLVRVADVDLAVLAGGLAIDDVAVGPIFEGDEPPPALDTEAALFQGKRIEVRWSWLALLRGEVHLEGVEIEAPRLMAVTGLDGRLVPLVRPGPVEVAAEGVPPDGDEDGSAWPLRLDRLVLSDLDFFYLNLARPDRAAIELGVEAFELDGLGVRGSEIELGSVGLHAPRLRVHRNIDLEPFVGAGSGQEHVAPAASGAPPPAVVRLAEISIERADLTLVTDEADLETHLSIRARDVTTAEDARFPLELDFEVGSGTLAIRADLGLTPVAFDGTLSWNDLPLDSLTSAAGPLLPLRISSGRASGALELDVLLSDTPERGPSRIDASGSLSVSEFAASESGNAAALSWSALEIVARKLSLRPDGDGEGPVAPLVELASVRLSDPSLQATLRSDAGSPAVDDAEGPAASEEVAPADDEAPLPEVRVALLEVAGGRADVVDETVDPVLRSSVRDLTLQGRNLRWPEAEAEALTVAGRGPGKSRFDVDASLEGGAGQVNVDLTALGLTPFSPYARDAAGYEIEAGQASLRARVEIAGERYAVDSKLSLHRLDVAEIEPGTFKKAFGVPLDLALALLRDAKGRIALPIGVTLERGESRTAIAGVVVGALRQALVGALSSPLKGLGLALDAASGLRGGLDLEPATAAPGEALPDLSGLDSVAEVLEVRPGLGLRLQGRAGPEDSTALAERVLTERVVAKADLPPLDAGPLQKRRLREALERRARGEAGELDAKDSEALARWIAAVDVPDERYRELAAARAAALKVALVRNHGVSQDRIATGDPTQGAPGVVIELAPLEVKPRDGAR
jgi:hypothetical protein